VDLLAAISSKARISYYQRMGWQNLRQNLSISDGLLGTLSPFIRRAYPILQAESAIFNEVFSFVIKS
jgi:hypothetical protein